MLIYQLKIISLLSDSEESEDFDTSDENIDGTAYVNIADLFNEAEDIDYILTKHHRCAVHTLNLIATNVRTNVFILIYI